MGSSRTVLVTGAEGALGTCVVQRYLAEGCQVLGTWLRHKPVDPAVHWLQMDVTNPQSVKSAIQSLPAPLANIDTLVHCAGGFRFAHADAIRDQDLDFLFDTNLRSAFFLVRETLPRMKKNGFGRVILISSKATLDAPSGMGAYAASKAGLNALVSSVAHEVRSFDININAVLPSVIDTAANRKDMPQSDFSAWVKPEALADIIWSLTAPWGRPINGALIPVSGRL